MTDWDPEILEIKLGALTYLFDRAPSRHRGEGADDRLVVVWGRSTPPTAPKDAARMAGFLRGAGWTRRGHDRGHLVAHGAGGGLDLNLVPQLATLNRGRSGQGRRWRRIERYVARHPGTPLFVRPLYGSGSWIPSAFDYGLVRAGRLNVERFWNGD
jgi:hypothetical protein